MNVGNISFLILFCFCSAFAGYRRICYYTNWSQFRHGDGKFLPNNTDPYLCTHITFAFGKIEQNGLTTYVKGDEELYREINELKLVNPDLKTLLAVGGWNQASTNFSAMVSKTNRMNKFIATSIRFLRAHGFDGLDLDWEFPGLRLGSNRTTDKRNFATLCRKLRTNFEREATLARKPRLLLSVAVAATKHVIDVAYDVPTIASFVDFINLMTYDFHGGWKRTTGHHSLLYARQTKEQGEEVYNNVDWSARYWVLLGASKEQINIGLPLYGRGFTLDNSRNYSVGALAKGPSKAGRFTKESGYLAYYEICEMISEGGKVYRDTGVPYYVKGSQWIGYDDEESISTKVQWLIREGFGGAFVWALPLDDFNQICSLSKRTFPLTRRMADDLIAAESVNITTPAPNSKTTTNSDWSIFGSIEK